MTRKEPDRPTSETGPEWDQFKRVVGAVMRQPHVSRAKPKPAKKRRRSVVVREGQS